MSKICGILKPWEESQSQKSVGPASKAALTRSHWRAIVNIQTGINPAITLLLSSAPKLLTKWQGAFEVTQHTGTVDYEVIHSDR